MSGSLLVAGGEVQTWQGGAGGAMEERGGGAQLQLQDVQAWRKKLSRSITFTFPKFEVFFICDFESIVSA